MSKSPEQADHLSGYGEFDIINQFFSRSLPGIQNDFTGIGDDCAILPFNEELFQLGTTDMLIENTHFIKKRIHAKDLGYKALAVNFSDIAAMGGEPSSIFLSLGLPGSLQIIWLKNFMNGFFELSEKYNVPLLGGDTTRSKNGIIINVMVIGRVKKGNVKKRSGSRPGDKICITEFLGDSSAGLSIQMDGNNGKINERDREYLIQRHQRPPHSLDEGHWLGQKESIHAMIDVSDGIGSDLFHLIEESKLGMDIHLNQLPVSDALIHLAEISGNDIYDYAVNGGEDYGLLLTVDPLSCDDVKKSFKKTFRKHLFEIGEVTNDHTGVHYYEQGSMRKFKRMGYDHFR